ncbi:MAG: carbohydrate binding family 9 domain-containing protein [Eudoraea sp.]|nr:carbohydrate binding family 9 domain-containing protein [Eudoraea sp.]
MKKLSFTLVFFTLLLQLNAQKKNEAFRINIRKTNLPVKIDGIADDEAWEGTDVANDFFMVTPMDIDKATDKSEIRMTYDDTNIYLIATFYNSVPGRYFVESLRRDFSFNKNDNFLLFLDPFNNQTTGFSFGSNAAGAQWDGTMFAGGSVDLNWDSKWISAVTRDNEKWVFEMALPFKSIRYEDGVKEWGINFSRLHLATSEKSSWTPIPRQFPTASLAYTGVLVWDEPPPTPRFNFSLIPYVLGQTTYDLEENTDYETKVGGDVKISLSSSLNLDLTINPDFSQVEVDRQITNLDRFELFFPERRQFFLENADLFANFGYETIRPFFSRRIGLGIPINGGLRLSGNLGEKWRLGVMDIQTAKDEATGLPSQNFGVFSLQRQVFSRSTIGLLFVNKQSTNYPQDSDSLRTIYPKFNRNLGLEYNLASPDNLWNGKAFLIKSFTPDKQGNGITQAANIEYKSRRWNWGIKEEYVDSTYTAEVGFVPRKGYFNFSTFLGHLWFPDEGPVVSHGPVGKLNYYFDEKMKETDHQNILQYQINFRNRSSISLEGINEYVKLLAPFDPTGTGKDSLATGTKHRWNAFSFEYKSRPQSMFTYAAGGRYGGYYEDGTLLSLTTELGYRFQPYVSLSSNINYNNIKLPEPWNTTEFWLIGSEIDITFTNKLFFANLFQYNEQSKNFNLNSRLQWRYKPASDLFLVYTNNELLAPLEGRIWSITLKLTYWFNK